MDDTQSFFDFITRSKSANVTLRGFFLWMLLLTYYLIMEFGLRRSTNFPVLEVPVKGSIITLEPIFIAISISAIPVLLSLGYHTITYYSGFTLEEDPEEEEGIERKDFFDFLIPNTKRGWYLFGGYLGIVFGFPVFLLLAGRTDLFFDFVSDVFLLLILSLYILGLKVKQHPKIESYLANHQSMTYAGQILVEIGVTLSFFLWLDFFFFA